MAKEPKKVNCPNCLGPAIKEGNEIACEVCDAVFVITKKEGAKVKQLGSFEDHGKRISLLEAEVFPEPESEEPVKPEELVEPEEPSILG